MLQYKEITSAQNPQVVAAKELQARKGRAEQGAFLCDGEHLVAEAIAACPQAVRCVFVDADRREKFAPLLKPLEGVAKAALYAVPARIMESLSQVKTSQGIAAVVDLPKAVSLESLGNRLLLLENVQDPGNVGTMLRALDAAGFDGCILTQGCADPFAPKTLRATMGSVFRVPLVFAGEEGAPASAVDIAQALKARAYAVIASTLDGDPFYRRSALPDRLCLMIGNEGAGLTPAAAQAATHRLGLPMAGGAESLNAAVAAAIMMYDLINRG